MGDVVDFPNSTLPETELIPPATKALETVRALEGVSRTDAVNRALIVYARFLELREQGLTLGGVSEPRGLLRRRRFTGIRWDNPFHDTEHPTED